MPQRKHRPEEIVGKLRQVVALALPAQVVAKPDQETHGPTNGLF